MSEENKDIELQGDKVSEPLAEPYPDMAAEVVTSVEDIMDEWDPGIGPYSMEEMNARIDQAEEAINRAKSGDWSGWITESQSRENIYTKFPWLSNNLSSFIITMRP